MNKKSKLYTLVRFLFIFSALSITSISFADSPIDGLLSNQGKAKLKALQAIDDDSCQEDEIDSEEKANEETFAGLRILAEVIDLIQKKAIRRVDFMNFIVEGLKATMPITVDTHSAFFSKKSYAETIESTSGKFSGIGVSIINSDEEGLNVIDAIEGGPAHAAGVQSGDIIIGLSENGKKTLFKGLATDEMISKIKGPLGSEITIKVLRDKKLKEFTLKRDVIKNEISTSYRFPTQNVYYLSLRMFTENASKQLEPLLAEAVANKARSIILDLRRNPGGVLDAAVDIASLFLDNHSLVALAKDRQGTVVSEYYTHSNPVFDSDIPIFILTDNFTASAAEIIAGTLQLYAKKLEEEHSKRKLMVFVLGQTTYGKGSVQEVIPISFGCTLKLTTMLYYLADQKCIQAVGIKPDFELNPLINPKDDLKVLKELYGTEATNKHHITCDEVNKIDGKPASEEKELDSEEEVEKKEESREEKKQKALQDDYVIRAALAMSNMLHLAKKHTPEKVNSRQKAISLLSQLFVTEHDTAIEKVVIKEK